MTLHDGCRTRRQRGSGGPLRPQREPRSTLPVCPGAWALEAEIGTPKKQLMPLFTGGFDSILSSVTCYNTSVSAEVYQGQALCMHVSNFGWLCILAAQIRLLTVMCSKDPCVSKSVTVVDPHLDSHQAAAVQTQVSRSILLQPNM